jgi:hypothetical protein
MTINSGYIAPSNIPIGLNKPHNSNDSNDYKNYNNVIDTLKCVALNNAFVHQVTTGDIYDIDLEKNTLFPLVHITPKDAKAGMQTMNYNFQIFVCDLVEPHLSNEQEVLSDCLSICLDLVAQYKNGTLLAHNTGAGFDDANAIEYIGISPPTTTQFDGQHTTSNPRRYWKADGDTTFTPFTERFENAVTGWVFDFGVLVQHIYSTCDAPFDEVDCRK